MMKQNILIIGTLFFSSLLFAQEISFKIRPEKKMDSATNLKPLNNLNRLLMVTKNKDTVPVIKMPNAIPKDPSIYLALKGKAKREELYKILNAVPKDKKLGSKF